MEAKAKFRMGVQTQTIRAVANLLRNLRRKVESESESGSLGFRMDVQTNNIRGGVAKIGTVCFVKLRGSDHNRFEGGRLEAVSRL
jgi:hypothetical protein